MNNFQINIYLSSIFALGLSIIFNYIIFTITKNRNYQNNTEEVRLSKRNVPPLGGIAIALSFLISVRLLGEADSNFVTIGMFGVAIALLGVFDDFFNLNWKIKLFFQILFVSVPIALLNVFLNFESMIGLDFNNLLNIFISTVWIVLLINSINFIDNMDGLAVVITGGISIQIVMLTYIFSQNKLTDISIILLFTMLGFFVFNFPPAKLYLGDSGSLFIGFLLGFISILFTWNNTDNQILSYVLSPIVLFFTIPILDFFVIMQYRISNKLSPTTGGTDHISHRLLALGFSEKKVLFLFFIYSAINFILIICFVMLENSLSLISFLIYLVQLIAMFNYLKKLKILS
jgi:UDP-GlcNAc:undecaprenyl-phosphate GlcNAc-1-phosphate transferase